MHDIMLYIFRPNDNFQEIFWSRTVSIIAMYDASIFHDFKMLLV